MKSEHIARKRIELKNLEEEQRSYYRPIEIDWEEVKRLLRCGCDGIQIAASMGFGEDHLYNRCRIDNNIEWARFKRNHQQVGVKEILETQHEVAIRSKDRQMLIWLGKVRAGQYEAGTQINTAHEPHALKIFKMLAGEVEKSV